MARLQQEFHGQEPADCRQAKSDVPYGFFFGASLLIFHRTLILFAFSAA